MRGKPIRNGAKKEFDLMGKRDSDRKLPSITTAARILARKIPERPKRQHRRARPSFPKCVPQGPNDIWAADYKGQFLAAVRTICFSSRQMLAHAGKINSLRFTLNFYWL
jgi:hypothetical protein